MHPYLVISNKNCVSIFSNLQQVGVVCFNFMKNILILFRQLIRLMGQCHVDTHHTLRRGRERSISQIIQSRIQSACLSKICEPPFKSDKYLSTSLLSDKTFVPAELFLCHGEDYDVILKLFMTWERNHSCASYDCVVFKLVLGRFSCKYFTPPIWWSGSYSYMLRSHRSYCLACGVSVHRLSKFASVHSLKM